MNNSIKIIGLIIILIIAGLILWPSTTQTPPPTDQTPPVEPNEEEVQTQTVSLYYYNPQQDTDEDGNIMCSPAGLMAVERNIPITQTPIQDTINLLLEGELTSSEVAQGIETEYPLPGFELVGAALDEGVLTLEFNDPQNQTTGGSCRVGILWNQIASTGEQFVEVNEVRFIPEDIFQP